MTQFVFCLFIGIKRLCTHYPYPAGTPYVWHYSYSAFVYKIYYKYYKLKHHHELGKLSFFSRFMFYFYLEVLKYVLYVYLHCNILYRVMKGGPSFMKPTRKRKLPAYIHLKLSAFLCICYMYITYAFKQIKSSKSYPK